MSKLLEFINRYYSFLYDDLGARFVDSLVSGLDALLVFELGQLRVQFVRDRGQIDLEFQSKYSASKDEWFSLDVVRYLLTGTARDNDVIDGGEAEFVRNRIKEIDEAFSSARHFETEQFLRDYKEERAIRLFG